MEEQDGIDEFEEEEETVDNAVLLRRFETWKKDGRKCCRRSCFENFRMSDAKKVWNVGDQLLAYGPRGEVSAVGKAMRKVFITSIYLAAKYQSIGKTGEPLQIVKDYIIPYYKRICCRTFFREMFQIGHAAMNTITARARTTVAPKTHALMGRTGEDSNRSDQVNFQHAILFVKEMAIKHGMPWPVRVRLCRMVDVDNDNGEGAEDVFTNTEYIMPASFTKRELFRMYESYVKNTPEKAVCWTTFRAVLNSPPLSNVRISKSEKGVCGTCLSLCASLKKQPAGGEVSHRMELLERVRVHLNLATAARRLYRADCKAAERGEYSVISWDFATKIKIPTFQAETQSGFQAAVHGLDYNVFGVVDEGKSNHKQTNMVFKEGRKVYTDVVISLVHQYLSEINPAAGKASLLVLWMDSCGGQNRNKYLLQYLYTRVLHGLNDEIRIKFMVCCVVIPIILFQ
tara:strand:- start:1154 stop:2521 length:1368 start_codon:yes stop_codon:yes gene_type:complete